MMAHFASTILDRIRSYKRLNTFLAAFVVTGALAGGLMIVSGRAEGLTFHWPASVTAGFSGASSLTSPTLAVAPCVPPSTVYVDDDWSGATPGTDPDAGGPATNFGCDSFATIQDGIDGVPSGGTVIVYAGTYTLAGSISLNKPIVLQGPNSAISPNGGARVAEALITGPPSTALRISSPGSPVTIQGFKFDSAGVVDAYDPALNITIRRNIFSNGISGGALYFLNAPTLLTIDDNHLTNADLPDNDTVFVAGNWNGTTGTVASITNNVIDNTPSANAPGMNLSNVSGTISGNQFTNLLYYAILLANDSSSMTISGNVFDGIVNPDPVGVPNWGAGVRFYTPAFTGPVNIKSNTFKNSYVGVGVRASGGNLTGMDIHVNFNRFVGNTFGIRHDGSGPLEAQNNWWGCNFGPGTGGVGCTGTPNGLSFAGGATIDASTWLLLRTIAAPSSIPQFTNSTITADMRQNSAAVDTSGSGTVALTPVAFSATEGTMAPPTGTITAGQAMSTFTSTSTNNGTACSTVDGQIICTPITVTPPCVPPATVYVDDSWVGTAPGADPDAGGPATNFGCNSFATIQNGVNGVAAGGTVNVLAGTYIEDVAISNAGLSLLGFGAGTKTISGFITGDGATVHIFASNVTVAGFTITREGNNTTDWNNAGLNTVGIAIQGQSITNTLIRDNVITGNRTGIDINNSNGHTVRNNVIDFNRTGLIFRNQTDQMTVVENFITNNWTVGILFLDGSGGSNVPPQSALNSTFSNNNLSGNWYGQVVERQTGGSLPAPGTTNLKNFRGNWFGTTTPVVTTANSTEPGYAAQIPVAYGGSATPPGGQPDIAGPASANIQYTPFLLSGTDTNIETTPGRGTFGFQGVGLLVVTPAGGAATPADNDYTRINNAVQAALNGQTIKLVGAFDWTEPNAAASWAKGSDGVAATGDDYSILVRPDLNNVTFTADNLGDASIQGPGDLAAVNLEGVLVFDGGDNQNWTISKIRFLDFDLSIGMFNGDGGSDAFNNTQIINNYIRIASDLNTTVAEPDFLQNIGIHYSFGTNQVISGNTIEIQGNAISNGSNFASDVGMQSNTSGGSVYDGLQITNNIVRVLNAQDATNPQVILGIWENGHAHTSNITVSGNQFINQAAGNNPATNLQRGFRVTSHSSATTTVLYQNNTVGGANIGFQWLSGTNFAGNQPVVLKSNTITGNGTGVLVQSQGVANLSFNRIVGNTITGLNNVDGIVTAENNWWGCNAGPGNAGCDSVTGTADFNPWLVLGVSASPSSIPPFGNSTVTADMRINSDAVNTSASGTLPPTPVAWSATQGTMSPPTGTITSGLASSTFTSNSSSSGTGCATVDNQLKCADITVVSFANVSGTKTKSGGNTPGSNITYTVVLSNSGGTAQADNSGNEFTDTLPSSLTLVSASSTSGTAGVAANTVTWNGSIPAGGSVTITITATINSGTAPQVVSNQGTINYDSDNNNTNDATRMTDDPAVGGASDPTNFTVVSPANVSGTKTKAGGNTPGQTVTYTVVLSNSSSSAQFDNPGNEFTDTLPASLTLVSATATSGTATTAANTVNWNGSIAGNGSVTITITATINNVPDGTIVSNQGTINYDADGNGTNESVRMTDDPAVGGASDPTSFAVVSKPDLTITKTHSGNFSGGQVGASYTLTVNNIGTGSTSGQVTVTDVVPVGLTPTGPNGVVNGWTCAINGQTLTCTRSDVLVGGSSYPPITLTVNVANPAPLNVVNTATVSGGGEVNTANNTASDPTAINCSVNFALNNTSPLMISRFRENGPAGPQDEFVEIYNPNPIPHTVASGNCNGGGYGVYASAGNGTTADTATLVCYIPNGTVIPAGGYYLCTGVTYSLNNLGLNGGAAGATATGDAPIGCGGTCGTNIPDDAGLVLTNKAAPTVTTPEGFGAVEFGEVIYDKVGFGPYGPGAPAPGYPSQSSSYCEGGTAGCLKPVGDASTGAACTNPSGQFPVFPAPPACYGLSGQYEFLRRQTTFSATDGTIHQDTNNNGNDFILVAPNPATNMGQTITGVAGVTGVLGAARPYNRQAPPDMPAVKLTRSPFDGADQLGPRNLERRFIPDPTIVDLANNPLGTLILRFRFTNNSGIPVNGIRFSVDNLSTLCGAQTAAPTLASVATGDARNVSSTPGCGTGSFTAIFKALNSTSEIMVDSAGTAQFVNGTVMEDLSVGAAPGAGPLSPKGGGIDSTFIINPSSDTATVGDGVTGGVGNFATVIGTTDPTKLIRVRVKFGVVRSGRFILLLVPMARNSPTP